MSMTTQNYHQLILHGIQDLPPNNLEEIVDFIFFIRQKLFNPQQFDDTLQEIMQTVIKMNSRQQDDTAWLSLTEPSFEFWDNEEDAIYDRL